MKEVEWDEKLVVCLIITVYLVSYSSLQGDI